MKTANPVMIATLLRYEFIDSGMECDFDETLTDILDSKGIDFGTAYAFQVDEAIKFINHHLQTEFKPYGVKTLKQLTTSD